MLECRTDESLARAAFMYQDDKGDIAINHYAALNGLIFTDIVASRVVQVISIYMSDAFRHDFNRYVYIYSIVWRQNSWTNILTVILYSQHYTVHVCPLCYGHKKRGVSQVTRQYVAKQGRL